MWFSTLVENQRAQCYIAGALLVCSLSDDTQSKARQWDTVSENLFVIGIHPALLRQLLGEG